MLRASTSVILRLLLGNRVSVRRSEFLFFFLPSTIMEPAVPSMAKRSPDADVSAFINDLFDLPRKNIIPVKGLLLIDDVCFVYCLVRCVPPGLYLLGLKYLQLIIRGHVLKWWCQLASTIAVVPSLKAASGCAATCGMEWNTMSKRTKD